MVEMKTDGLDMNSILSNTSELKHSLVLYASDIDKYTFQTSFLMKTKRSEKVIYVTNDNPDTVINKFSGLEIKLSVLKPEKLSKLKPTKEKVKIILDAASIAKEEHIKCEEYLTRQFPNSFMLCGYDITRVDPTIIEDLVAGHEKLILMTSGMSVLSSSSLDKLIGEGSIERFVKKDLEMIIFALLMNTPMCGTDIMKTIHKNFNVLLSPGTIYPLLHDLEKRGLVQYEYAVKKKIYKLVDSSLPKVKTTLDEHIQVSTALSKFLLSRV